MIIIPIEMSIDKDDILNSTSDDIESSIKEHIIVKIIESISSMLDDENFIEMIPSKDESTFDVKVDIIIGAASKYTDAVSTTISNLLNLCTNQGVSQSESVSIISKATAPLSNALKTTDNEQLNNEQLDEKQTNEEQTDEIDYSADVIDDIIHDDRTITNTDMIDSLRYVIVNHGNVIPLPTTPSAPFMSIIESIVAPTSAMLIPLSDEEELTDTIAHNTEPEPHVPDEDDGIYYDDDEQQTSI